MLDERFVRLLASDWTLVIIAAFLLVKINLQRNKEGVSSCHVIVGDADIMFRKYENVRGNAT